MSLAEQIEQLRVNEEQREQLLDELKIGYDAVSKENQEAAEVVAKRFKKARRDHVTRTNNNEFYIQELNEHISNLEGIIQAQNKKLEESDEEVQKLKQRAEKDREKAARCEDLEGKLKEATQRAKSYENQAIRLHETIEQVQNRDRDIIKLRRKLGNFEAKGYRDKEAGRPTPHDHVMKLEVEVSDLREKLKASEEKARKHKDLADKATNIILVRANPNVGNDEDLEADFKQITQSTQLVCSFCTATKRPPRPSSSSSTKCKELYSLWDLPIDDSERDLRIQAFVFRFIHDRILQQLYFGLSGTVERKGSRDDSIERGFVDFERKLLTKKDDKERRNDIWEWRVLTMKCVKWLNYNCEESYHVRNVAKELEDLLKPIQKHEASDQEQEQKFQESIFTLCKSAYIFTLTIRSYQDTFSYNFPDPGTLVAFPPESNSPMAEVWGEERELGVVSSQQKDRNKFSVAYTLFAGLVRSQVFDLDKEAAVVPALVIARR